MRKVPANGAAVSDLWVRDVRERLVDQRKHPGKRLVALQRPVSGQRPDPCRRPGRMDPGEILNAVDIDQDCRLRQAEIHRRHQALPASKKLRVIAILGLERKCLRERGGGDVFERSRLHGTRV